MTKTKWSAGIDIGGTKINVAAVDAQGQLLQALTLPIPSDKSVSTVQDSIYVTLQKIEASLGSAPQKLGIGIAGQVDAATGMVHFAPNLDWRNISLKQQIEERLHLPVNVTNDVRAATWGEWKQGAGIGSQHLVCVFVGTGIGGGIISNGQLLTGYSNSAGELGHVVIQQNGPPCTCGGHGCLEALAGGWAIAKQRGVASAKEVHQLARQGDERARACLADATHALAAGITTFVNAFNPERVILGGGVIQGIPEMLPQIEQEVRKRALARATLSLSFAPSQLKENAVAIGAALMATKGHP